MEEVERVGRDGVVALENMGFHSHALLYLLKQAIKIKQIYLALFVSLLRLCMRRGPCPSGFLNRNTQTEFDYARIFHRQCPPDIWM
jgi:hypothetical protein